MESAALDRAIVQDAIEEQMERPDQSVEQFADGVERRVRERTDALVAQFGDAARGIAGEAMRQAASYAETRKRILSGFVAKDLTLKRADGLCNKQTNEVFVEKTTYMDIGESQAEDHALMAHAAKVRTHELTHRDDQAQSFDLNRVMLDPARHAEGVITLKDMTEGHSIRAAGQTDDELPPDYIQHRRRYEALLAVVDEQTVEQALKTGEISRIQQEFYKKHDDISMNRYSRMPDRRAHVSGAVS